MLDLTICIKSSIRNVGSEATEEDMAALTTWRLTILNIVIVSLCLMCLGVQTYFFVVYLRLLSEYKEESTTFYSFRQKPEVHHYMVIYGRSIASIFSLFTIVLIVVHFTLFKALKDNF